MNTGSVDVTRAETYHPVTTRVSVIVPAFNEEQGLAAALRSIRQAMEVLDAAGWRSELIVCDNNSTDRTADIARAAGARVVFEPINQISRARNAGAAVARGDWLVFVDADSHPSAELFVALLGALRSGRAIAGGSTLCFDGTDMLMATMARVWNAISRCTRWAAGSFMFCESVAFREVGGFSRELYATEEIDLFRRLKQLARRRGRTIEILRGHPLRTSARKARLYTWQEAVRFIGRTLVRRGRTLRSAEECFSWYDGRR
ncbi:MAG: glycosyltransferase [Acidobacteria bacterium]|nr:glycosyltransferase [Acidobacteriota bacterium]